MKTVSDYRADMLAVLGDPGGRRYTEPMQDMALREALETYRRFCPRRETVRIRIEAVEGTALILQAFPEPAVEILTARMIGESGDPEFWLAFGEYRTDQKIYLNLYSYDRLPAAGSLLQLEISMPHKIKGLNDVQTTTVPDAHEMAVITGAAAAAMRIRARSVTEVFGKRPEDREALTEQANEMEWEFLAKLAALQPPVRDPWPRGNFEI